MTIQHSQDLRGLLLETLEALLPASVCYQQAVREAESIRNNALRILEREERTTLQELNKEHLVDLEKKTKQQETMLKKIEKIADQAKRMLKAGELSELSEGQEPEAQLFADVTLEEFLDQAQTMVQTLEQTMGQLAEFEIKNGDYEHCQVLINALQKHGDLSDIAKNLEYELNYQQAVAAVEGKQWNEAQAFIRKIKPRSYKDTETLYGQAAVALYEEAMKEHKFDAARKHLQSRKSLENLPDYETLIFETYYQEGVFYLDRKNWDEAIKALWSIPVDISYKDKNTLLRNALLQQIKQRIHDSHPPVVRADQHSDLLHQLLRSSSSGFRLEREQEEIQRQIKLFGSSDEVRGLYSEWHYAAGCAAEDRAASVPNFWEIAVQSFLEVPRNFHADDVDQRLIHALESMVRTGQWGPEQENKTNLRAVYEECDYLDRLEQRFGKKSAEFTQLASRFYEGAAELAYAQLNQAAKSSNSTFIYRLDFMAMLENLSAINPQSGAFPKWINKHPILKWVLGSKVVDRITPQFSFRSKDWHHFATTPDMEYIAISASRERKSLRGNRVDYLVILNRTGQELLHLQFPFEYRDRSQKNSSKQEIEALHHILDAICNESDLLQIDFQNASKVLHVTIDIRRRKLVETTDQSNFPHHTPRRRYGLKHEFYLEGGEMHLVDNSGATSLKGEDLAVKVRLEKRVWEHNKSSYYITSNADYILVRDEDDQLIVYTHRYQKR